jgi:hypothetical protein
MAFSVHTHCKGSFQSPHGFEKTMEFLLDFENSIGKQFECLESFQKTKLNTYCWTFESISYGAHHLQISFVTEFKQEGPHLLTILPVKNGQKAQLSGFWQLTPNPEGTRVQFEANLVGELPLPVLMKSIVTPLAQKEVRRFFERYLENVAKAI